MRHTFIIGEQRSGSNLLRLMLDQGGIAAPHPPHVLTRLDPLLPLYGPLSDDAAWRALVNDGCTLVERNPIPWSPLSSLCRQRIAEACRERSLIALFGSLMDRYAEARGRQHWVCKSMHYARFAPALDRYFGAPRYIYLYRDPRDVTLSFMRAVVGEKHPYHIAKRWAEAQRVCIDLRNRIGDRVLGVSYEALTRDPRQTLQRICDFLDVRFQSRMLDFPRSQSARRAAEKSQLWRNLDQPLLRNNSRKFLTEMSGATLSIVESVAGDVLRELGYEPVAIAPGQERRFSADEIRDFTRENQRAKAAMRAEMDPADARRRAHQLEVLARRPEPEPERQHRAPEPDLVLTP